MKVAFILCLTLIGLSAGCIQTIAVRSVGGIVHDGFGAVLEESDLQLVEAALPANLKLLEVMLKNDPANEQILLLLSEGYSSYALGFVEDTDVSRARDFYLRGRDFGLRVLREHARDNAAFDGSLDDLKRALAQLTRAEVPAVFWTAFGMGGYLNLTLSDPEALAQLPRAEAMMEFVLAKDPSFYYGGAHLFLGTLYGSRPRIFGGDSARARTHFERALAINRGRFLMTYVYYARSCAIQALDEALFDDLLGKVEAASLDILPEFRLANAIAKQKARALMVRKPELF